MTEPDNTPRPPQIKWVAVQRNPKSGAGRQSREIDNLLRELQAHGFHAELYGNRDELDTAVRDPARREALHGIVAAGGDGTLLDVMNRHPEVPVAILPMGTENLCAKHLQMPFSGTEVAKIVADGHRVQFDVGRIGEQRFMVMASAGFDAAVIHAMHRQRKGHISRISYLKPIGSSLLAYRFPALRVYIDDDPEPIIGRNVVVANLPSYALGLKVASDARPDDGLLDVRVMQHGSVAGMFRYLALIYYRRHERVRDVISRKGKRIRIESDQPVPVQIDGDPAGMTPVEITVEADVGELFVPKE